MIQQSWCFTIGVTAQKSIPFIDTDSESILQMQRSNWYSLFYPPIMQADPFLFVKNDTLYLFYEYMPIGKGLGVIMVTSTKDLKHWTKPCQITNEPNCHFSYPFVFEDDGVVYMIPETGCEHNIRLYKAVNEELTQWEVDTILLERTLDGSEGIEFDFADNCIYKNDQLYYLFTSILKNGEYRLELYIADHLRGPYKFHPASPICQGNQLARCAGSLIEADGKLFRPAQDCLISYGSQIHLVQIDELTSTTYSEHLFKENILPQDEKFYIHGGHHINFAKFHGKTLVATDARYTSSFFLERVRIKIMKLLGLKENKPF